MSDGHSIGAPARFPSGEEARLAAREWRHLDAERRLRLVADALRHSDGIIDLFPLAL